MLLLSTLMFIVFVSMAETQAQYEIDYQECGGKYCTPHEGI